MRLPVSDLAAAWSRIRWPSRQRMLAMAPFAAAFLAFTVIVIRGCSPAELPDLRAPEGVVLDDPATATTAPPGGPTATLGVVDGTTTVPPPLTTGRARLFGSVMAPEGPVSAATVRIERFARGETQRIDVLTAPDGRWEAPGIPGGRYRVRAFAPPILAQTTPEIFFIADGEERSVELPVERFEGTSIAAAVAPDPPVVDQALNLVIQVTARSVDLDGFARAVPVVAATVRLNTTGTWTADGPIQLVTGADGQVVFRLICRTAGPTSLVVVVGPPAGAPPVTTTFEAPSCVPPAPTTTVPGPTTSTTRPRAPTTSSTTSSSVTTTTV